MKSWTNLFYDVLLVVIPESSAQFIVVHAWPLLQFSPSFGNLFLISKFELAVLFPRPHNKRGKPVIREEFQ